MSDTQRLIQTIEGVDMFSIFARLMKTSGANEIISDGGPFTVFVPTNDAFGKIPDKVMDRWLSETGHTELKRLLSYHIVPSKIMAANVGSTRDRESVSGEPLKFTDLSGLRVNHSGIQARNMEATNGVVHALDTVLTLPTQEESANHSAAASVNTPSAKAVSNLS
jgi:uncharacterized surface protein with fasciclin (FAS1) repeats